MRFVTFIAHLDSECDEFENEFHSEHAGEDHVQVIQDFRVQPRLTVELQRANELYDMEGLVE